MDTCGGPKLWWYPKLYDVRDRDGDHGKYSNQGGWRLRPTPTRGKMRSDSETGYCTLKEHLHLNVKVAPGTHLAIQLARVRFSTYSKYSLEPSKALTSPPEAHKLTSLVPPRLEKAPGYPLSLVFKPT